VDGKGVGDVEKTILKERRYLSSEGLVIAVVALDGKTGSVLYGPEVSSHGFLAQGYGSDILENAKTIILENIDQHGVSGNSAVDAIQRNIRKALRKYFYFVIQRKPVIFPIVFEM
jgi:ribonuclease J